MHTTLKTFLKQLPIGYPICIDLDGTLTTKDLTFLVWQSLPWTFKKKCLLYSFKSHEKKVLLKKLIHDKGTLNPASVSWRTFLLDDLKYLKDKHPLFLVTGTLQAQAQSIAQPLGLFHEIQGTWENNHLVGKNKGFYLSQRFGHHFVYIGNSFQDIQVWNQASHVIAVNPGTLLKFFLQKKFPQKPLLFL
jgi:hypothetical protein